MVIQAIQSLIEDVVTGLGYAIPKGLLVTEPPSHAAGDLSCNAALLIAKQEARSPREMADGIAAKLMQDSRVAEVAIAGPGFLNITLTNECYLDLAQNITNGSVKESLAISNELRKNISVEYVSANPSGPLHIGNARGGPLGEAISRVLQARGHTVTREFYVNDVGGQANRFAQSVLHFYAQHFDVVVDFPEDGYQGAYVQELAKTLAEARGSVLISGEKDTWVEAMREAAIGAMITLTKEVVARAGIQFDLWFWEHTMLGDGIASCLNLLEKNGAVVQKDGARWLRAGITDDDRETVLVKSDGSTTYFMNDLAYHYDKLVTRKNDFAVCLLGADHSGHPPRMRAGMEAMGLKADQYKAVVYQYVQLKKDGKILDMSKRTGKFVTAAEVLDEVPRDVFIYFMVSKANETHVDFDLQLAKDTSENNPVYSIQYAHARIASLLERAATEGMVPGSITGTLSDTEKRLLRHLSLFQTIVADVSESFRINLLCQYLQELAARYHQFYAYNRVLVTEDSATSQSRLTLSRMTRDVIKEGLALLNISAPETLSRSVEEAA